MRTKISILNIAATSTAIGLVAFSGTLSAIGLARFVPGAEIAVVVMAVLFECAKLIGFALVHRPAPRILRLALLATSIVLMTLNIMGVAGFLSNAYERQQIAARATAHTAESTARAEASLLERQLANAESAVAQARMALVRARDDKGRVKAAQAVVAGAIAERDALVTKLSAANTGAAKVEGERIQAGAEFAAVVFLAAMFGVDQDTVAHVLIAGVASLPDILAGLLVLTIGSVAPKVEPAPKRRKLRKPRKPIKPPWLEIQASPREAQPQGRDQ